MITVEPFRARHLEQFVPQPAQRAEFEEVTPESARAHELAGPGYSILVDGEAVACAVLAPLGDGRGALWALVGAKAGPYMLRAKRTAEKMMRESGLRRIEAVVETEFVAGHRWMGLLGFELETPKGMRAFGSSGQNFSLYSRIL